MRKISELSTGMYRAMKRWNVYSAATGQFLGYVEAPNHTEAEERAHVDLDLPCDEIQIGRVQYFPLFVFRYDGDAS